VLERCRAAFPGLAFELRIIKTTGDKLQTASLASSELPKGLFTKEIEEASSATKPTWPCTASKTYHSIAEGLKLGATLKRADVRDVLICAGPRRPRPKRERRQTTRTTPAADWPCCPGRNRATSSTRRRAQLLDLRPDLNIVPIRGTWAPACAKWPNNRA